MIIQYIINYCLVMFAMCVDNLFWISSSPEYKAFKLMNWFKHNGIGIKMNDKFYLNKLSYILNYRIKSVLTDKRDIIPAILTSGIMTGVQIWLM